MKQNRSADSLGAGILLIGMGLLFMIRGGGLFFPWVLAVIGLAGIPAALRAGRTWAAWHRVFWLIGLAILFATHLFWPGILVLVGASMLLRARGTSAPKPTEADVAREPVTTETLPVLPFAAESVDPETAIETEHGTAPLSSEDLDAIEAELAAQVEGPIVSGERAPEAPEPDSPAQPPASPVSGEQQSPGTE